jgi:Tfp pilus assembly PilM family ATPase/Tfp pilus assembly protein PilN
MRAKKRKNINISIDIRKKVFGIDVCNNAVSFVELRKRGKQIKVVRCGIARLDSTIVNNGIVKDPAALTKVLKQFKIAGTFRTATAAISICAEPVLLQILDMPDSSPGETRRFIQNEVKQYAILPLKNIEMDYCGLKSSDVKIKRVLIGATQSEHLSATVKTIEKDNINIMSVEPAVTAFIRICYDMIIKPQREQNIIFLLVRDDTLNLCLFERQGLDFLRIKKFETDIVSSQERGIWLSHEIESVIQFHELERGSSAESWQIFVTCCPENKYSAEIVDEIKGQIIRQDIEVAAFENDLMGIIIEVDNKQDVSPVATGVAMKLLDESKTTIKLNLLPRKIVLTKKERKQLLIIINVAAVIFLFLLMHIMFMVNASRNVCLEIYQQDQFRQNIHLKQLASEQAVINKGLQRADAGIDAIKTVFEDKVWYNWAFVLTELGKYTPRAVQIQKLRTQDSSEIQIEGLAVGYDAINDFVSQLSVCKVVKSVQLSDTKQNKRYGSDVIDYSISCSLANNKEIKKD